LEPICRTFSRLFVRYSVWEGFEGVVPSPGWDVSLFLLYRSFIYFYGHFDFVVLTISRVLVGCHGPTPRAPPI
jgi:hypothetical protein